MTTKPKTLSESLRAETRRKIGRSCWFTHPDTGEVIRGVYARGRKVTQLVSIDRPKNTQPGQPREYGFNEKIWTVPRNVRISFNALPPK